MNHLKTRFSAWALGSACALSLLGVGHVVMAADDFTFVGMSDTQYTVESFPNIFQSQTQWASDHATDPAYNVAFLSVQGDMLRRGYSNTQATQAKNILSVMNTTVPYTVAIGNHDFDNQFDDLDHHISSANFTSYFGDALYQSIPLSGFGGSSLDQNNRWSTFTAAGQTYLVLNIEWEARDASIAWAQSIINAHRNLPTILVTHEYLNGSGRTTSPLDPLGNSGEGIYQKLVKLNPQIFLVLNGHTGAVYHQTSLNSSTNPDWQPVFEAVSDFEGQQPNGGDGYFQLFHFFPASNTINVTSYSPYLNQSVTGSAYVFSFPLNFATRFSFANGPIGNDDTYGVTPGVAFSGNVLSNDVDNAGTLVATLASTTSNGTLAFNADGTFTYTANPGFHGTDTFSYQVSDGTSTGNIATVNLRANTAPVAVDDSLTTLDGRPVNASLTANDTDQDGDSLKTILKSLPAHGAVFVETNGTITYTPDPKFIGTDSYSYVASDGAAVSNVANVTITVASSTPAPVYAYPVAETTVKGTVTGSMADLQASDGIEEVINEVLSSGSAVLEQRWQFNVTPGDDITLAVNAHRGWGTDEYKYQYSTNGGSTWADLTQIVPASSKATTRINPDADEPYQMWKLPSSTSGTVWIRASDDASNSDLSSFSVDEIFIRTLGATPVTIPNAPTNLTGNYTKNQRKEKLSWTDNATNESGFHVWQSTNNGASFTQIATTSANTTSFTTSALTRGVTYQFKISAYNSAGESAYSNTITQVAN